MRKLLLFISVIVSGIVIVRVCQPPPRCPPQGLLTPVKTGTRVACPGSGNCVVTLWIGADKDTFTSSDRKDENFGCFGFLTVAGSNPPIKRAYIHFLLPSLPAGTEVLDAKIELYHGGEHEDGKTDDLNIPLGGVLFSWSPLTLTWNMQPNPPTAQVMMIHLRSKAWSGSRSSDARSIIDLLGNGFGNVGAKNGFVLDYMNDSPSIEKGFVADNDPARTAIDLNHAPRLLLRVQLPPGTSTDDIKLPNTLPSDTDLWFPGTTTILMLRHEPAPVGSPWPATWDVSPPS